MKGDTREVILGAALQAFSEHGFDATSTRDIVKRAGVNHGLIRYHFGGKDKLWREAVDRAFEQLTQGIDAVLTDESIESERERVGRLIRDYVRFVAHRPAFVRLMHDEGKRTGPRMRWMVDRHIRPLFAATSTMLEKVGGVGARRRPTSPVHFFYVLAGAGGLMFHQAEECKRISGVDPFDEAVVEEHALLVEELLLGPA